MAKCVPLPLTGLEDLPKDFCVNDVCLVTPIPCQRPFFGEHMMFSDLSCALSPISPSALIYSLIRVMSLV
jgi:hypothetical protein